MNFVKEVETSTEVVLLMKSDSHCCLSTLAVKNRRLMTMITHGLRLNSQPVWELHADEQESLSKLRQMGTDAARRGWTVMYAGPPLRG